MKGIDTENITKEEIDIHSINITINTEEEEKIIEEKIMIEEEIINQEIINQEIINEQKIKI